MLDFAIVFHVVEVPLLAAGATVTAVFAPDFVKFFSILFIVIASWITFLPVFRPILDSFAVRIHRPELFTPATGVPKLLRQVRSAHVLLYALYGGFSLARPEKAELAALLFADWVGSLIAYTAQSKIASSNVITIGPGLHIPPDDGTPVRETVAQLPMVQISFPRMNEWLSRM